MISLYEQLPEADVMMRLSDLGSISLQGKQVQDLQKKIGGLQGTLNELEKTAQSQMHALAGESKMAIMAAQSKLTSANRCIQEFHKFLKVLTLIKILYVLDVSTLD